MTDTEVLDAILALQLTIAWAGDDGSDPRRLGWWQTDVIDETGGGDLLARLLPQTHKWAAFEATREAARRTDAKLRSKMANGDRIRTLFFLGFALDEQLTDRLSAHKRSGRDPRVALALPAADAAVSEETLASWLKAPTVSFTTVPNARELKGPPPEAPDALVRALASALLPLAPQYPLPYFKVVV